MNAPHDRERDLTVVSRVSPTDGGWVSTSLTSSSEAVSADSYPRCGRVHGVPRERLEVKSGNRKETNV